jgi:hypothetical protein
MVAAVVMTNLAPLVKKFLPGSVFNVPLGTLVTVLLWVGALFAIVKSSMGLLKIKTQIVRLLDSRCKSVAKALL